MSGTTPKVETAPQASPSSPKAVVKAAPAAVDTLTPSLFKWFLGAATLVMFYYAVV